MVWPGSHHYLQILATHKIHGRTATASRSAIDVVVQTTALLGLLASATVGSSEAASRQLTASGHWRCYILPCQSLACCRPIFFPNTYGYLFLVLQDG